MDSDSASEQDRRTTHEVEVPEESLAGSREEFNAELTGVLETKIQTTAPFTTPAVVTVPGTEALGVNGEGRNVESDGRPEDDEDLSTGNGRVTISESDSDGNLHEGLRTRLRNERRNSQNEQKTSQEILSMVVDLHEVVQGLVVELNQLKTHRSEAGRAAALPDQERKLQEQLQSEIKVEESSFGQSHKSQLVKDDHPSGTQANISQFVIGDSTERPESRSNAFRHQFMSKDPISQRKDTKAKMTLESQHGEPLYQCGKLWREKDQWIPLRKEGATQAILGYVRIELMNVLREHKTVTPRQALGLFEARLLTAFKKPKNRRDKFPSVTESITKSLRGIVSRAFNVPQYHWGVVPKKGHQLDKEFHDADALLDHVYVSVEETEVSRQESTFRYLFEQEAITEAIGPFCVGDTNLNQRFEYNNLEARQERLQKEVLSTLQEYIAAEMTGPRQTYDVEPTLSVKIQVLLPLLRELGSQNTRLGSSRTLPVLQELLADDMRRIFQGNLQKGVFAQLSENEYTILLESRNPYKATPSQSKSALEVLRNLDARVRADKSHHFRTSTTPISYSSSGGSDDEIVAPSKKVRRPATKRPQAISRSRSKKTPSKPRKPYLCAMGVNKLRPVRRASVAVEKVVLDGVGGKSGRASLNHLHKSLKDSKAVQMDRGWKKVYSWLFSLIQKDNWSTQTFNKLVKTRKELAFEMAERHARTDGWAFKVSNGGLQRYFDHYSSAVKFLNKYKTNDKDSPYQGNISPEEFGSMTPRQKSVLRVLRLYYNKSKRKLERKFTPSRQQHPKLTYIAETLKLEHDFGSTKGESDPEDEVSSEGSDTDSGGDPFD